MSQGTISTGTAARRGPAVDGQLVLVLLMLTAGFLSIAVTQLTLGLALLMLLYRWIVRRQAPPLTGLEKTAALLAAWALVMVPFSSDVAQSALYYRRFYLFTAIWVTAGVANTEQRRTLLFWCLMAGALTTCLHDGVQQVARTGGLFAQRMAGMFNSMTSGALLMLATLTAAGFLAAPGIGRRHRLAVALALPPLVIGMLMTMTRSVQMGLAAGIGALLLTIRPRIFGWFAAALAVLAIVFAIEGGQLASHGMWKRVTPQYLLSGKDTNLRLEMWRGGWNMVRQHPVTGLGDRGLEAISPEYYTSAYGVYFGHLHSNIVHMAAIWGIPGMLLGQAFIFAGLWYLLRRWRVLLRQPGGPGTTPAAAGWVLGAIAVWAGFYVAGLTEWYFGDAEPMLIYLAVLGAALGSVRQPAADRPGR